MIRVSNAEKADLLDDAADSIENQGWFNPRKDIQGSQCAATSLGWALHGKMPGDLQWGDRVCVAESLTRDILRFVGLDPAFDCIVKWNDSHDNPQPVLDAYRALAKEYRKLDDLDG